MNVRATRRCKQVSNAEKVEKTSTGGDLEVLSPRSRPLTQGVRLVREVPFPFLSLRNTRPRFVVCSFPSLTHTPTHTHPPQSTLSLALPWLTTPA